MVILALAMVVACAKMDVPTGEQVGVKGDRACSYTDPGVGSNGSAAWVMTLRHGLTIMATLI